MNSIPSSDSLNPNKSQINCQVSTVAASNTIADLNAGYIHACCLYWLGIVSRNGDSEHLWERTVKLAESLITQESNINHNDNLNNFTSHSNCTNNDFFSSSTNSAAALNNILSNIN